MSFAFHTTAHIPDIRAYGGVGDGTTDCGPAFRHALESARHAGGGRIFIPPGRWRIQTSQHGYADPHSAAYWIANGESNIVIEGAGSASQLIVETPRLIGYDTSLFYSAPRYTINEALAGSTQIILSNPSDISHFSIGEIIFIRTGNVAGADAFGAPDSEFNVVTGLDSNTGAITVSTPLSKDYQVEYYPPGGNSTNSVTTLNNTGPAAELSVSKCPSMPSGLRIANLHIDHSTNCWATISGAYLKDLTLENVTADADGRFLSLSAWYRGSMSGCNIHILANTNTNDVTRWWFTTAWGSSDVDCVDNTFSADYYAWVHVNEGSVRCRVLRNSITAAPGFNANNQALVNYANRGYSCVIQDNIIRNPSTSPGGAGIRIGASSSWPGLKYRNSVVDGNTIYGGYASIIDNSTTGVTSPRGNVWVP